MGSERRQHIPIQVLITSIIDESCPCWVERHPDRQNVVVGRVAVLRAIASYEAYCAISSKLLRKETASINLNNDTFRDFTPTCIFCSGSPLHPKLGRRKRLLKEFRMTRGAIMLQNMYRRYLAVRERRRRARIVKLALGAGLRTLGRAINELEGKAATLQACEQVRGYTRKAENCTSGSPKSTLALDLITTNEQGLGVRWAPTRGLSSLAGDKILLAC